MDVELTESSQKLSTADMLARQQDIIRVLFYVPSIMTKYVHYRGLEPIEFRGIPMPVPPIPFIPYDDSSLCCILDEIEGFETDEPACRPLTITALGPKGKVGIPYIIKSNTGTMVVKISKVSNLHCDYRAQPPGSITALDSRERKHCITNVKFSTIRYIASDEFTNETLIAYALNFLADELSLPPLFVRHYQGAICSINDELHGLNIMENCDLGTLSALPEHPAFTEYVKEHEVDDHGYYIDERLIDPDVCFQILAQVTVGLHMLQSYAGFTSGDLKAGNVFVKSDPIDIEYLGIRLKAPFTCKIADFGKSSCMLPRANGTALRFYTESTLADIYLAIYTWDPDIEKEDGEYYYTVGYVFTSQIYPKIWHMGIPFYRSFDYYTVLVSMLTHPAFYYTFFSNPILRSVFWDPIWKDDNIEVVNRIHHYVLERTGRSINDAIAILKGMRLKCDAVTLVMKRIRDVSPS